MTDHFVYDNAALNPVKTNLFPLSGTADPNKWVQATDWNQFRGALIDIQAMLRGGTWFGLAPSTDDPAPPGVTDYLWLHNAVLTLCLGGLQFPVAQLNRTQAYTGAQNVNAVTLVASGTTFNVDASLSNTFDLVLGADVMSVANPTNLVNGATYIFRIHQDATGGRTLSFGNVFKFPGDEAPLIPTAASTTVVVLATCDGTNLYCSEIFAAVASSLSQVRLINDETSTVPPGTPVYINAAGRFKKARANDVATTPVFGITSAAIAAGVSGPIQMGEAITLTTTQWDAICGTTGGLSYNVPYYLDAVTAGKLTPTPPTAVDDVIQQVLLPVSPTQAKIIISAPQVIGSGSNIIRLRNDDTSPLIIGSPVYSDAPSGINNGRANNSGKSIIIGLVADASIAPAALGNVLVGGVIVATSVQWDAICGTSGGLANVPYYLDPTTPGRLTSVAPTTTGQEVVQVIVGYSSTKARIAIQPPILL